MTADDLLAIANYLFPDGSQEEPLRLFGGLACWHHCPNIREFFNYRPRDVDVIAPRMDILRFTGKLKALGFRRRATDYYNGGVAYRFQHENSGCQLDAYVGLLAFNHRVPADGRLQYDWPTLPLAELAATKLQIHKAEEKDFNDILMLFAEHEVGHDDQERINVEPLIRMCGHDWGLWHDVRENLHKATILCSAASRLSSSVLLSVTRRLRELSSVLDECPKALRWRVDSWRGTRGNEYWDRVEEFRKEGGQVDGDGTYRTESES